MEYEDLLCEMSREGVKYLTIDGYGVVLSGFLRTTGDLDLLVDIEHENLKKIIDIVKNRGYKPTVPVELSDLLDPQKRKEWYEEKGMIAFMLCNAKDPFLKIDLLINSGGLDFNQAYQRKKIVKRNGGEIYVASIGDLIKLKELAGRDIDLFDLKKLRKLKEQEDDK